MPELAGQVQRLEERIKGLESNILEIKHNPYLIAQQVFGSLAFYREFYGSMEAYHEHLNQVVGILRTWGRNLGGTPIGPGKFLLGLADLLEEANRGGVWPGLKGKE